MRFEESLSISICDAVVMLLSHYIYCDIYNVTLIYSGHSDCVRGLAVINAQEFLSCSNDSSVRRWSIAAGVLQVGLPHKSILLNGRIVF